MGIIGYFLIDKMLPNEWVIKETAEGPFAPTAYSSVMVSVVGSPLEIIISNAILVIIII